MLVWVIVATPVVAFLAGMFLDGRSAAVVPIALAVLVAAWVGRPLLQFLAAVCMLPVFGGTFAAGGFQIRRLMQQGRRATAAGAERRLRDRAMKVGLAGVWVAALLAVTVWPAPSTAPLASWLPRRPWRRGCRPSPSTARRGR